MPRKKKPEAITVSREPDSEAMPTIKAGEVVGGYFEFSDGERRPILTNTEGEWSTPKPIGSGSVDASHTIGWRIGDPEMGDLVIDPDGTGRMVGGKPIGYTALLMPLRSEFPAQILPEPTITDAEWSAMVEAIRASEEEVIALPVPASCHDVHEVVDAEEGATMAVVNERKLRECADALRVTACALGVGLTFYPRKAATHTIREGKERREEVVPAALMVRRLS